MADGIHCLVFSKDRAMQLDAFLRSARKYAPYQSITVTMRSGADLMFDVQWHLEQHARAVFHTDDDVFFAPAADYHAYTPVVSYRLGFNTTYCHPLNCTQKRPTSLSWNWRDGDGDFGYPLTLNATVYNSADLLPLLDFHFSNPTELEAGLAARASLFKPQRMFMDAHSSCVSLPHNVVSTSSNNPRGGNPDWQPDRLNEMFLDGWRIDLDAMDFSNIVGAHQEVPLKFRRG